MEDVVINAHGAKIMFCEGGVRDVGIIQNLRSCFSLTSGWNWMEKLNVVIVDDELYARESLRAALHYIDKGVNVAGSFDNLADARDFLSSNSVDILFLDINMGKENGFELLETLGTTSFKKVLVTAYEEYAVKAFRHNVDDYLLKPVDIRILSELLKKTVLEKQANNRKLKLTSMEEVHFVDTSQILFIEAQGSYSRIVLSSGKEVISSKVLKHFENLLQTRSSFIRINRSYIVNFDHVEVIDKKHDKIVFVNGQQLHTSVTSDKLGNL